MLLFSIAMSFPKVQTSLGNRLTSYVNKKFGTDINVKKIDLSYAGQVQLKEIFIKDRQHDTIIFVKNLRTSILNFDRVLKGKPQLGPVYISDANVVMRTYKGNEDDELMHFIDQLDGEKTEEPSGFLLTSDKIILENTQYKFINLNDSETPIVTYRDIYAKVKDFKIEGPSVQANVRELQLVDQNGLVVTKMATDFVYTKAHMNFLNTHLQTLTSDIKGDIKMSYDDGSMSDFKNRVRIDAFFKKSTVSLLDLKHFYKEFGTQDVLHFSTKMKGTLNDFTTTNLRLKSDTKAKIYGNVRFINSFNTTKGFQVIADLNHLESDYNHLVQLLPRILGKTLPISFKKLGHFSMSGHSHITSDVIKAMLKTDTAIGSFNSDLTIKNFDDIDRATYEGDISFVDFPLGNMVGDSLIGNLSLDAHVIGKGFTLEHLNTQIKGEISKHQYKGYTYRNISIDGKVKDKLFSGIMIADDPNLKFYFKGLADLSQEKYRFDFVTTVDHAEFNKLNLIKRDSISILKGDIQMVMVGNKLENMEGFINFNKATYTNQVQDYHFKDFTITSKIKDSIQTLRVDSSDIVNGYIKGKFLFEELPRLAQNAFGSIYTNYKAYEVSPDQHFKFRFKIFNQVVAVFFPEIALGKNSLVRGEIDSDDGLFRLTFKSPEATAFDNVLKKIRLQIDNKNPIFNTQLSVEKVNLKHYELSDLELVNITLNDTLQFRSEFNGGGTKRDKFKLAFYHTFDENNQSILGFKKSSIFINDSEWQLNPNNEINNKLIYNTITNEIVYKDFLLTSKGQELLFNGYQQGNSIKNYNIDLDQINLEELMPEIENFDFKGLVNGGIWIESKNNQLIPTADVQILDLYINNELQGDLIGEIRGIDSNTKYQVDINMDRGGVFKMVSKGNIDLTPKVPTIDLDISLNDYPINILNAIAAGVMENIRGGISGKASIRGPLENPNLSGTLSLSNSGVYFPYINIDYALDDNTLISLNNQSFVFKDAKVFDTLFETSGILNGSIDHEYFKKWYLDIEIETDNLMAINTPEEENSLFYGTGFLNGNAFFTGNTDNVNIEINGSSNPGTEIIIPMSDVKTVETSRLIHFKKPKRTKEDDSDLLHRLSERFQGVTMDFNLDLTKDATIEMVVDQTTGSSIQGNGTGEIQMYINHDGTFNMYGDYIVDKGLYNFKYGEVINKSFTVKKGGSISFAGDPYQAELDIEAVYQVKANPKVILPEYSANRDVPVELITKITGELFHSKQEFDINIPNSSVSLSSGLDLVINDKDTGTMMTQFVSLLVFGNFISQDNLLDNSLSNASNEYISDATMAISNAVIGLFSDPDDKIKFGFDYKLGRGEQNIDELYTEDQLGVSMATRIGKRENIIINGEVNVPTGSQSNANIAGEVSIEMPLNKAETLSVNVFNRQNEIPYSDEEEGYTQGIGFSWKLDFNNWQELLKQLGINKTEEPTPKANN